MPMLLISDTVLTRFDAILDKRVVAPALLVDYKKWLRYFLDFCSKYPVPDIRCDQVRLLIDKLREKRQSKAQQEQAAYAVSFYFELQRKPDNKTPSARFDTEITSSFISEPQQAHNMLPLPSSIPPKTTSFPGPAQGLRCGGLWKRATP
jgi:hypothetical protein